VANTPGWESPEPARQRRAAQIERFKERQRKSRKWLNFAEIAEYYTREDQSILPIDLLARDLLVGEFEENGHSLVLFLHPTLPPTRMTREWLKNVIKCDWGRPYLEYCWIPWRLFERWLARHRLPASPSHFQPQKSYRVSSTKARDESAAIKALASYLKSNPQMRRVEAVDWCHEHGYNSGTRAFDRVWPEARERAGLERIAPPGRKRKSPR